MVASTNRRATPWRVPAWEPTAPIPDDQAYRAVIRVLDRLFERGASRTPAETESFRVLARHARQYEIDHPACWA